MDCFQGRSGRPAILAIVYKDSGAACRMLSELGHRLRDGGAYVSGLVGYQPTRGGAPRCDMEVEELASGFILQLTDDCSRQQHGCRIDPAALQEAAALISASFVKGPDLLIINKFGQLEAGGGGLIDVISEAVDHGIPVMVGVPERLLRQWRSFTQNLAEEAAPDSPIVTRWLSRRGLGPQRARVGVETVLNSAA